MMPARGPVFAAALLTGMAPAAHAEGVGILEPFQMVRSLQLVQDRIAAGDHAALPMQRKLLGMIDKRLRDGGSAGLADLRNFRAMLVYAMSGGNPATLDFMMANLDMDEQSQRAGSGILNYLNGRTKSAQAALAPVDPMKLPPEMGAFIALVKGSVISAQDPAGALKLLDQARLLGPGTLVEEAALRRSITLSATADDVGRFLQASSQYVRFYLRSPYASQFADAFVAGVITLHATIKLDAISDITANMDADQQQVIYLRIARRAAIDGLSELSAFASAKAVEFDQLARSGAGDEDSRALLYSSLSSVTSDPVEAVRAKLGRVDRAKLSPGDRKLLDAVTAVVGELGSLPPPLAEEQPPKPAPTKAVAEAAVETIEPPKIAEASAPPPAEANMIPAVAEPIAGPPVTEKVAAVADVAVAQSAAAPMDAADTLVVETRKKLDAIDKMLGDNAK